MPSSHLGPPTINWDYALSFHIANDSGELQEPPQLSSSATTTSASPTQSVTFAGDFTPTDLLNTSATDWTAFSLPSSDSCYLGNATQMLAGVPSLFTTAEENRNLSAMSSSTASYVSESMSKEHSQSGSSHTSTKDRISYSSEQSSSHSKLSSSKNSPLAPESSRVEKRKANTLAARRYRQKRVDAMCNLEAELKDVKAERDDYKVRCARLEGEVETLRALLRTQK